MFGQMFFPYPKVRNVQDKMLFDVDSAIKHEKNLIMHAPTGIGKTAAVLSPALARAVANDLTVFFLTSRHTQHLIAIETLKQIKKKYKLDFNVVDLIGKKWMCSQPGVEDLFSNEFADYCKRIREDDRCEFFLNVKRKNKVTLNAKKMIEDLILINPCHTEKVIQLCKNEKLCPYETSILLAKKATVVVTDYYYIFNSSIRESFFLKTGKNLENSIIIIDEAHNLPNRLRELMSFRLTNFMIRRAIKEAKKYDYDIIKKLQMIQNSLNFLSKDMEIDDEKLIKKQVFVDKIDDHEGITSEFILIGDEIREKQKQSYIGSIGNFLDAWLGQDKGFVRFVSVGLGKAGPLLTLSYKCLDPSLISKEVFDKAYCSILMSGTLTPTEMYKDLLGLDAIEKSYKSPFPKENKLSLIIPETTTKFSLRNNKQYEDIAKICSNIIDAVPGNIAIFFPSYELRDNINYFLRDLTKKKILLEKPNISKKEKRGILDDFKKQKKTGGVLLGVASGSFGESIDLPGDLLKAVIVVGLPLQQPNVETKALINYYDEKFGKGWDYGYVMPAFTKCMQNAGRCIRSEKDKGATIFLDKRYSWNNYLKYFPVDWDIKVSKEYKDWLKEFFF